MPYFIRDHLSCTGCLWSINLNDSLQDFNCLNKLELAEHLAKYEV